MITDFVDGYYARKTKTITAFGKIFDPIADKVATTLMLIFLAITRMTYLPVQSGPSSARPTSHMKNITYIILMMTGRIETTASGLSW